MLLGCRARPIIGIIGIGISVFFRKSESVSVWYSNLKIGIGKVKSPKNRLESVSVWIGKWWIRLKDSLSGSREAAQVKLFKGCTRCFVETVKNYLLILLLGVESNLKTETGALSSIRYVHSNI